MDKLVKYDEKTLLDALHSFSITNSERATLDVKSLKNDSEATLKLIEKIEDFANVIANNGYDITNQKNMTMKDLSNEIEAFAKDFVADGKQMVTDFSSSSLGFFGQQIINRLVTKIDYESLDLWKMVTREMVLEDGTMFYTIVMGEQGPTATSRVAEGGSFRTLDLESTEDYIKTAKGKVGVMVRLSEEAIQRNGVALLKALLSAALQDMATYKALEAMRMLERHAKTVFDPLDTGHSELHTSGVSKKNPTQKNGTLLMKDIQNFLLKAQNNGFNIDTIFIHPLAYQVFFNEPTIKKYLEENAGIYFMIPKNKPTMYLNPLDKWKNTTTGNLSQPGGYKLPVPQLITNKALNVIVTPLLALHRAKENVVKPETRYTPNPVTQYTNIGADCADILFVDSTRALTYVHDGRGITSDKVEDRLIDMTTIKLKERYNFIMDKDHGVFAARNITITDDVLDKDRIETVVNYTKTEMFGA